MRLLNVHSLDFEEFPQSPPPYAILSHTWSTSEVLHQDVIRATSWRKENLGTGQVNPKHETNRRKGWLKVTACCEKAKLDSLKYVWVDTCCIDKTNSTELSEAINSMYEWYMNSAICYVYLEDVTTPMTHTVRQRKGELSFPEAPSESFAAAKWFLRGWTLQELLAPYYIIFFDKDWTELGTRSSLSKAISACTGIGMDYLENIHSCSIATKMSWAAQRRTTVNEDRAYSLLGLFNIRMPLIYGEGTTNAFLRLQQELIKQTDDESIFAWRGYGLTGRLFAPSPSSFKDFDGFQTIDFDPKREEMFMSNKGLIMSPLLYQSVEDTEAHPTRFLLPLNYGTPDHQKIFAFYVESRGFEFVRIENNQSIICYPSNESWKERFKCMGRRRICLRHESGSSWKPFDATSYLILFSHSENITLRGVEQQSGISKLKSARTPKLRLLPSEGDHHPQQVSESCFMTAGNFALAELTTMSGSETINIAIAVRRCTGTLSLQAWFYDTAAENLTRIHALRDRPPPATERRDFLQLQHRAGDFFQIRLQPRGLLGTWEGRPIAWNDLAPAFSSSKTYIVKIFMVRAVKVGQHRCAA